jgi:protease I
MRLKINNLKIAILVANGFEQSEMVEPKKALEQAGAKTMIISPIKGKVKGWKEKNWGDEFVVDKQIEQAKAEDFDGLVLPGGVMNPDTLRLYPSAIHFIKDFVKANKPIGAICHGPWTLIDAEAVKNRKITSWPSIKTDLINAGAHWVDQEVVKDEYLVTSRKPADIPAFNKVFIELLAQKILEDER